MRRRTKVLFGLATLAAAVVGIGMAAGIDTAKVMAIIAQHKPQQTAEHKPKTDAGHMSDANTADAPAPAITVVRAEVATLADSVLVTGTLVPREEILVSPEVEGLRILELKVDVGDRVAKGDVLAVLERTQLETQLAQANAAIARADAAVAQAKSQIVQADAAATEAAAQLDRATPLKKSGYLSESVFDQRAATARATAAQRAVAEDGLKLAEASKAEAEASRRQIQWRLDNTQVKAPRGGLISRRTARVGALATGAAEPMFRIIADGEIELEADVIEADLAAIRPDQPATVEVAGADGVAARVRLVSPEVDRATRLGKVRLFIGQDERLRIGAFGRARIAVAESRGVTVPAAAVMHEGDAAFVLVVKYGIALRRDITTGLRGNGLVAVSSGISEGDEVVARSGTFLRPGDRVRAVRSGGSGRGADVTGAIATDAKVNEAQ